MKPDIQSWPETNELNEWNPQNPADYKNIAIIQTKAASKFDLLEYYISPQTMCAPATLQQQLIKMEKAHWCEAECGWSRGVWVSV